MIYVTKNEQDTKELGKKFASGLKGGEIICLYGDLGAGKTTFTKGLAEGLGIDDIITSPTFTIMNEYNGRLNLYHFDMYRMGDEEEIYELGFDEYIYSNGVSVIEWNKMTFDRGVKVTKISIDYQGATERKIEIT